MKGRVKEMLGAEPQQQETAPTARLTSLSEAFNDHAGAVIALAEQLGVEPPGRDPRESHGTLIDKVAGMIGGVEYLTGIVISVEQAVKAREELLQELTQIL